MSKPYYSILTNIGENLVAKATALGTKLDLTTMAVGDGNGKLPAPDPAQTKLINEKRRAAVNSLEIDKNNPNIIIVEHIIPETEGGWWVREIGLFDSEGNLIAVGNCPETYKPKMIEGSGRTQIIRMMIVVKSTECIELKADPSVVLATREYVDNIVSEMEIPELSNDINENDDKKAASTASVYQLNQKVESSLVTETIPPNFPTIENNKIKLLFKNTDINLQSDFWIVTRKANGARGYVAQGITKIVANIDDANTGGMSPVRPSEVLSLREVFVGYFTPHQLAENITITSFSPETVRQLYGIKGLYGAGSMMVHNTGSGEINFTKPQCYSLPKDAHVIYKIKNTEVSVHFGVSPASASNAEISVSFDGVNYQVIKNISLKSLNEDDRGYCKVNLDLNHSSTAFIKIVNKSENIQDIIYLMGLNIKKLEDCDLDTQYDCVMVSSEKLLGDKENKYQNGAGANEFAAREDGGKWFGTYHGGHANFLQRLTLSSGRYNIDVNYAALPSTELTYTAQLLSISDIEVGKTTYSYTSSTIWGEGANVTNYAIELKQGEPIICTRAFVNMCTTSPAFNWVHHPKLLSNISGFQDITIGQTGFVEQYQASTTKTLRNYFSQVPMNNNARKGCYISYQAVYNKIYYGLILDKLAPFYGGNFSTCKMYS